MYLLTPRHQLSIHNNRSSRHRLNSKHSRRSNRSNLMKRFILIPIHLHYPFHRQYPPRSPLVPQVRRMNGETVNGLICDITCIGFQPLAILLFVLYSVALGTPYYGELGNLARDGVTVLPLDEDDYLRPQSTINSANNSRDNR